MAKQPDDNTGKSPVRTELPDSSKKFGNLTLNIRKQPGEEKGDLVEAHEYEDQGEVVARYVKKDGKVLQSAATLDAQESGAHEKAAKKAGVKAKDVVFTTPTMNAVQDYVEQHQDKDTPSPEGEKAELTGKTKEKKPKSKPSEGKKPDTSMSKISKEKTGQADKPGDRDIRKDMEKDRSLEKTDKIEDLATKRAQIKAALERKGKGNTKLSSLMKIVKEMTNKPTPTYDPADASGLASKIRSHHYETEAAKPKLDKADPAPSAEPFHDPAAHAKDAKLEAALQEKVKRHLTDMCLQGNLQKQQEDPLKKADDPLKPAGTGDPLKEMAGKQKFEGKVKEGLATYTPPEKKARPQRDSLPKTPKYKLLTHMESNAKTAKNANVQDQGKNVFSAILHLAPATLAGVGNVCESASEGCKDACLNTAGRGGMFKAGENTNTIQNARIRKTKYLAENPGAFMDDLLHDVQQVQRHAAASGAKPVVRLNGTSDLAWENFPLPQHGGKNIFDAFPDVQFYDYTKHPGRVLSNKRPNYHLTFSLAESNENMAKRVLAAGHNVAAVFGGKKLPGTYLGHPVISGDEHDLRFLDPRGAGHVIGLTAKGEAKGDTSGFVKWGHEGDPEAKPTSKAPTKRGQVAGHMKKADENDIEPIHHTHFAGKPGHTSTGKKMKGYYKDFAQETADWSPKEHMEAVAYHNKRATDDNLRGENKWDMSRAMNHYGAARQKGDMYMSGQSGSRGNGLSLPNDHEAFLKKIGMPEFSIGKVHRAHDFGKAMNQNPNKLKKDDYSHTENLDPNTGNPIHGYDSAPQPEMQGVAPKAQTGSPDLGLAGNINAAGAKAMGKAEEWPVPGLVPPKRDNAKLAKFLNTKGSGQPPKKPTAPAAAAPAPKKPADWKPDLAGARPMAKGMAPTKSETASTPAMNPKPKVGAVKPSGDAYSQRPRPMGKSNPPPPPPKVPGDDLGVEIAVPMGNKSMQKAAGAPAAPATPATPMGILKPKKKKDGNAVMFGNIGMTSVGTAGLGAAGGGMGKADDGMKHLEQPAHEEQKHYEAPKHLQGHEKAKWHTAQHEYHAAAAQEAEHEESRHEGQPVKRGGAHGHWARYHAAKAKEAMGKSAAPAVPDLKKHVPGVSDKKLDSCVSQVKKKGAGNAYAICTASLKKAMEHMRNGSQPLEKNEDCGNGDNPLEKAHPQNGSQPLEKAKKKAPVVLFKPGSKQHGQEMGRGQQKTWAQNQAPKPAPGAKAQVIEGGQSPKAKAEAAMKMPPHGTPERAARIKSSMEKINGLMAQLKSMHSDAPSAPAGNKPTQIHQPGAPMPKANAKAPGQGGKAPMGRDAKIRAALDRQGEAGSPYAGPRMGAGAGMDHPKGPKKDPKYEAAKAKQKQPVAAPKPELKKAGALPRGAQAPGGAVAPPKTIDITTPPKVQTPDKQFQAAGGQAAENKALSPAGQKAATDAQMTPDKIAANKKMAADSGY